MNEDNFNNNYNNKNNRNNNYVLPFAAFQNESEDPTTLTLSALRQAYLTCRKRKRNTTNSIKFELHLRKYLLELQQAVNTRTYTPNRSIAFVVFKPVQREIFAADFRDRIIHHWIAIRLEPLLEKYFISDSFSCRKNKGTLAGIKSLQQEIKCVSQNYTKDCYIVKMDLKSFFMSINRQQVCSRLVDFVREHYHEADIEVLIYLIQQVLLNAPEQNCFRRGSIDNWNGLPAHKSLFTVPKGYGLPIGNLTSQLTAGFFRTPADKLIIEHLGIMPKVYVDDTVFVTDNKQKALRFIDTYRKFVSQELGLQLHPHKFSLQHYSKGMKFIGGVVKRERIYISNRTVAFFKMRIHAFSKDADKPYYIEQQAERFASTINSYFGLMRHFQTYAIRCNLAEQILQQWNKVLEFDKQYTKAIVKQQYKRITHIKQRLNNSRRQQQKLRKQALYKIKTP